MSEFESQLPPNATAQERALEATLARIGSVPVPLRDLWSPVSCPVDLLPWLAWSLSVDHWESGWPESIKRDVIAQSVGVHKIKGTVAAIRLALANAGFDEVEIVEGALPERYDGSVSYDGGQTYGAADHWATYRLYLKKPISAVQAQAVTEMLSAVQPVRSQLAGLYYTEAQYFYDGQQRYDGLATYGAA